MACGGRLHTDMTFLILFLSHGSLQRHSVLSVHQAIAGDYFNTFLSLFFPATLTSFCSNTFPAVLPNGVSVLFNSLKV